MDTPKVLLGIPCSWRGVPPPFVDSIMLMDKTYMAYYARAKSGNPAVMRNMLVDRMLNTDASHLMLCDADGVVPHSAMNVLLEANLPVVGGIQWSHQEPFFPSVFTRHAPFIGKPIEMPLRTITKVYSIGFPAVMIQRDVLETLKEEGKPIFEMKYLTAEDDCNVDAIGQHVSSDHWFAEMCFRHDIPIYAHPGVKVRHLSDYVVGFQNVTQEPIVRPVKLS